jgi:hypothetical protein
MSHNFEIVIRGRFSCSLRRRNETHIRLFSTVEEATQGARHRLHGKAGTIRVIDMMGIEQRIINLEASEILSEMR